MSEIAAQLPHGPEARDTRVGFSLAAADDDAGIRRLLRETPMSGGIALSLEREPSAFGPEGVEGSMTQTLVAKDADGKIVATGSRSIREAYVNGEVMQIGYLGQLRVAAEHRGRDVILGGYRFLRELHGDGLAPFYLTAIMAENKPARRLLEANLRGMPVYTPVERWVTFAIPARRCAIDVNVLEAREEDSPEIAAVRARWNDRHRFASGWQGQDRRVLPAANDVNGDSHGQALKACPCHPTFIHRVHGGINGVASVWDQRAFKQTIVRGYDGAIARWRWLINALSPVTRWPRLPAIDQAINQTYLHGLAVDDDDPRTLVALLRAALSRTAALGCDYLLVGLAARHPLAAVVRKHFRYRAVESILYTVHFDTPPPALDDRITHVEVATL